MQTKIYAYLALLAGTLILSSCDPGHQGNAYLENRSAYELELKFSTYGQQRDTTILIPANTKVDLYKFGGLGAGNNFDCCPCEFKSITLGPTDPAKSLIKNITASENWSLSNPNERRFQNKNISCAFIVTASDIE